MCPCPEEGCSNLPGVEGCSHSCIHYCSVPREPSFPASPVGLSLFLIRPSSLEYGTSLVGKERVQEALFLSLSHGTCTWKNLHHMSSRPILNPDLNLCMKTRVCNFPIFRHFAAHAPPLSFNTTISSKPFVNLEGFMATTLVQPSIADTHVKPLIFRTIHITKLQRYVAAGIRSRINSSRFVGTPLGFRHITVTKVAEQSSGLLGDETVSQNKTALYQAVEGINRGIFGIPSAKKSEIETLVKGLESQNPTPDPTLKLEKLAGCWRLVYSTISILGSKRTKLGLRDFVSLDEFFQTIDVAKSKAVNTIKFSAKGLSLLNGQLSIEASYEIASTTRVAINFESSKITPDQLMNVFRKNYDVLLGIFNPEGWLEITYVDDSLRIGRDDKGNIFVLERFEDNNS